MSRVKIAPSVLSADFSQLGSNVHEAELARADLIHIDVMDGRFVPNITMGPLIVESIRRSTSLPLDLHLMIIEPERHIETFAKAGADRITIHLEATTNVHRTLQQIKELGCQPGIAINPHTPASAISEILDIIEVIIVMTVNPGFGGQHLITSTLSKVTQIRDMTRTVNHAIDIEVDGGINTETVQLAVDAGANVIVAGSSIFNTHHSIADGIKQLTGSISFDS